MAQKYSDNEIPDLSADWSRDEQDDLKRPFSKGAVQRFLKRMYGSKIGAFYKDTVNNEYLCFADRDSMRIYQENPAAHQDLVLARFQTEAQYYMTAQLTSGQNNTVFLGSTGNYFRFTFQTVNRGGSPIAENVRVAYTIKAGSVEKTANASYVYGNEAVFSVDEYVGSYEGVVSVSAAITGEETKQSTIVSATYYVVNLSLSTSFNMGRTYDVTDRAASLEVPVHVGGSSTRYMEYYIDGVQIPYDNTVDMIDAALGEMNLTRYITLPTGTAAGVHTLQFRVWIERDGQKFYSDMLYREFTVFNGLVSTYSDRIMVGATIPSGASHYVGGQGDMAVLSFEGMTQYVTFPILYATYATAGTVSLALAIDGNAEAELSSTNGNTYTYGYMPSSSGAHSITLSFEGAERTVAFDVAQTTMNIAEITQGLLFRFQAGGRTNKSANRDVYEFGQYSAIFSGFRWNATSGWVDGRLLLAEGDSVAFNIKPLSTREMAAPTTYGRTLEFEFSTVNVTDSDAVVCDLTVGGVGLKLTASEAHLASTSSTGFVSTKYKEGSSYRVSFVINPMTGTNNKQLAFVYVDGILSGVTYISTDDNFNSEAALTFTATAGAGISIRQVLVYDNALSAQNILNNYILYRDTVAEMVAAYNRNDILQDNMYSASLIANQLPVMIVTGDIPTLENKTAQGKGDIVIMDEVQYINMQNPSLSFTARNIGMSCQGTSSMSYPKKNFRLYSDAKKSPAMTWFDHEGEPVTSRVYAFRPGAQAVNRWCLKADYAESSSSHNTGIARLWNDAMKNATLDGQFVCRTQAQEAAIKNNFQGDVRTTIDGFPIVMFYRRSESEPLTFMGKYNFNNDKATESVFGFKGIPGFDNRDVECWEVSGNGNSVALFTDVSDFGNRFQAAFESRYPDDAGEETEKERGMVSLYSVCTWINSTKGATRWNEDGKLVIADQTLMDRFRTEKWQHLDVYKIAAYYIYLMRFGGVDQTVKNAMFTTEGPGSYRPGSGGISKPAWNSDIDGASKFYYINYDNDTINGVRNDGILAFGPDIDRTSLDPTYSNESAYVYAGHDSVLWNNLEKDTEFMNIVILMEKALYNAGLTLDNVLRIFNDEQSGRWCERIYNQDAQYKYLSPYYQDPTATRNLALCQGSRKSHRTWWLTERFAKYDAQAVIGSYSNSAAVFRLINDTTPGRTFGIKAAVDSYYGYSINMDEFDSGHRLESGEEKTFRFSDLHSGNINIGDPVYVYNAYNLERLDLSALRDRLNDISLLTVAASGEPKMTELILGDETSPLAANGIMGSIPGLGTLVRLKKLDISGYESLTSLDLTSQLYLETLSAKGSGLTTVEFAEGCALKEFSAPSSLRVLRLKGLPYITNAGLKFESSIRQLRSITFEDCPKIDTYTFIDTWHRSNPEQIYSVTISGIDWKNVNADWLIALATDIKREGTLNLTGKISLVECNEEQSAALTSLLGDNVFNRNNSLYLSAPAAVYLKLVTSAGGTQILEGEEAVITASVLSELDYELRFAVSSGSRDGVEFEQVGNRYTIRTVENGKGTTNFDVVCRITDSMGDVIAKHITFSVVNRTYPTATIAGQDSLNLPGTFGYQAVLSTGYTGNPTFDWSLATTQGDVIMLDNKKQASCDIKVLSIGSMENLTLTYTIYKATGTVASTASKTISVLPAGVAFTSTNQPELTKAMYDLGLIADSRYARISECAAVTQTEMSSLMFKMNMVKFKFNEFQYFTNITTIQANAFSQHWFTEITLPSSITTIGESAFYDCNYLEKIVFNDGLKTIEGQAFYRTKISEYNIPYGVTSIGDRCFYEDQAETVNIVIPGSVKTFGELFVQEDPNKGVTNLTVTFLDDPENPGQITDVNKTFMMVYSYKGRHTTINYYRTFNLTGIWGQGGGNIVFNVYVSKVGRRQCYPTTGSGTASSRVKAHVCIESIGDYGMAFNSVDLTEGINFATASATGSYALLNSSVKLPNITTSMTGYHTFEYCSTIDATRCEQAIFIGALSNNYIQKITVAHGTVAAWRTVYAGMGIATSKFTDGFNLTSVTGLTITAEDVIGQAIATLIHPTATGIGTYADGYVGEGTQQLDDVQSEDFEPNETGTPITRTASYTLDGHTATAEFTHGDVDNNVVVAEYDPSVTGSRNLAFIPNGTSTRIYPIGNQYGTNYSAAKVLDCVDIEHVYINSRLTKLDVYKPDNYNWYYRYSFSNTTESRVVTFVHKKNSSDPDWGGLWMFQKCADLIKITLPSTVVFLVCSFKDCTKLSEVVFNRNKTQLGNDVFENCSSLKSIDFSKISNLGSQCFKNCGIKKIEPEENAYYQCYSFYGISATEITIPKNFMQGDGYAIYISSPISRIYALAQAPHYVLAITGSLGGGILYHPAGSDYSSWMEKLAPYGWTESVTL